MKKEENKAQDATIINGVVLTESAIDFLHSLQEDNNNYHKDVSEHLNRTILQLISCLDEHEDPESPFERELVDNTVELIKYLNHFNKLFTSFRKP